MTLVHSIQCSTLEFNADPKYNELSWFQHFNLWSYLCSSFWKLKTTSYVSQVFSDFAFQVGLFSATSIHKREGFEMGCFPWWKNGGWFLSISRQFAYMLLFCWVCWYVRLQSSRAVFWSHASVTTFNFYCKIIPWKCFKGKFILGSNAILQLEWQHYWSFWCATLLDCQWPSLDLVFCCRKLRMQILAVNVCSKNLITSLYYISEFSFLTVHFFWCLQH